MEETKGSDSATSGSVPSAEAAPLPDKTHVWPYLVRIEIIVTLVVMLVLSVWSIVVDAPLEEAANPTKTPNPSKAPWYFLGLQDMLVYFDPWIAGVVLPTLCIVGLMAIPYIDVNPKGNGYYTFRERPFAILTFFFGFHVLWLLLIVVGVFLRGPGWNFFWPWEEWDPHKVVAITNINFTEWLGIRSHALAFLTGAFACALWYVPGFLYYFKKRLSSPTVKLLGPVRYGVVSFLFLTMLALPAKMFLRIAFNIKYVWVTPWFNI